MKTYPILIDGGYRIDVTLHKTDMPCQYTIHLDDEDDTLGHVTREGNRIYLPTVHTSGGYTDLPLSISRRDAVEDIVNWLANHDEERLDLGWHRQAVWS